MSAILSTESVGFVRDRFDRLLNMKRAIFNQKLINEVAISIDLDHSSGGFFIVQESMMCELLDNFFALRIITNTGNEADGDSQALQVIGEI